MRVLDKTINILNSIGVVISGIAISVMMFLITIEVILRNGFNFSIPGGYEYIQNYLMPLSFFTALALSYKSGIFPKLDMFYVKIRSKIAKKVLLSLVLLIELIATVIVAYFGITNTIDGYQYSVTFIAGTSTYPLYPAYILVAIGFILLSLQILIYLVKVLFFDEEPKIYSNEVLEENKSVL